MQHQRIRSYKCVLWLKKWYRYSSCSAFYGCSTRSGVIVFVSDLCHLLWSLWNYVSARGLSRGVKLLKAHPPHDAYHQALQQSVTKQGGTHAPAESIVGGSATNHTHPGKNVYTTRGVTSRFGSCSLVIRSRPRSCARCLRLRFSCGIITITRAVK